eukprot:SAG31_NODE_24432_length_481_cov_1.007853_2_plen_86_part_00
MEQPLAVGAEGALLLYPFLCPFPFPFPFLCCWHHWQLVVHLLMVMTEAAVGAAPAAVPAICWLQALECFLQLEREQAVLAELAYE